jgi:putative component of toxin-antitoxin plasmid stabilization module
MPDVAWTGEFKTWIFGLADTVGRAKIAARLSRLEMGNPATLGPSATASAKCG